MKIVMKVDVSGVRDGQPWPARGEAVDLPDDEAVALCAAGMAEAVTDSMVETADMPQAEKRSGGRPRTRQ